MAHRENISWIYQARRVATQANAAGGAIVIDISLASGQCGRLIAAYTNNSGNNSLYVEIQDEDNAYTTSIGSVGAAAANTLRLPSIGSAASATGNVANSTGLIIPSGAKLTFRQAGAGVQNDTLTVGIVLELFNLPTVPTWSKDRSTNAADVTLAASTISAANTLVSGRLWQ